MTAVAKEIGGKKSDNGVADDVEHGHSLSTAERSRRGSQPPRGSPQKTPRPKPKYVLLDQTGGSSSLLLLTAADGCHMDSSGGYSSLLLLAARRIPPEAPPHSCSQLLGRCRQLLAAPHCFKNRLSAPTLGLSLQV